MTQYDPADPGNYGLPYQSQYRPYGSAPTLTKVAAILNIVMAGIDLLYGLGMLVATIVFLIPGAVDKHEFDGNNGPPLIAIQIGLPIAFLIISAAGIVKLVAGIKLLRRKPGAWGWTLAGGIVGCMQIWCSYFCVLPMGIGVFTIVVCCLDTVRRYLADSASGALSQTPA
ncbi:MAG TPA: hypothetical protein VHM90_06505 [Phycisphaerae bacterium]|jgi:hypothetical protein|nr:hypothetical protein [Phycisphaerae bacterium]